MAKVLEAFKSLKPKALHTLTPKDARKQPELRQAVERVLKDQKESWTPQAIKAVAEEKVAIPNGQLLYRVYTPDGPPPLPVIVFFPGGGFVDVRLDDYDATARALANRASALVVSIQYCQAPENGFPAAREDALLVFRHVVANANKFGGDASRIVVAGEQAGANLAVAVAVEQAKGGDPKPRFQLLIDPLVSNDMETQSMHTMGSGEYIIGAKDIEWMWLHYLGFDWRANRDPRALPVFWSANELAGLAPTLILSARLDPLRDHAVALAKKLQEAGARAEHRTYDGLTHGFFGTGQVVSKAQEAQTHAGDAIKASFAPKKVPPRAHQGRSRRGRR